MKKILFISDMNLDDKTGGTANGLMHYKMLKELFGDNFYSINISATINREDLDKCGILVHESSVGEKIINIFMGMPAYLNFDSTKKIIQTIEKHKIDIVFFDNSISGRFVKKLKRKFSTLSVVCFYHDIERYLMLSQIRKSSIPRAINLITMIFNEYLTAKYSDKNLVLNKRDADLFLNAYKKQADALLPIVLNNTIITEKTKLHKRGECLNVYFIGADYYPNVNGIRWFIQNVVEELKGKMKLFIIGNRMERYREEFNNEFVNVIGTVDSLDRYYKEADIIVAPIFEGGGMKVKTGESLLYGKTTLATSEALTGYADDLPREFISTSVFECNTKEEYINTLTHLFYSEYYIINQNLSSWTNKNYSFKTNLLRIRSVINNCNEE